MNAMKVGFADLHWLISDGEPQTETDEHDASNPVDPLHCALNQLVTSRPGCEQGPARAYRNAVEYE